MTHLLSLSGRAALQRALGGNPLLAFDFDGTLCPILDDPTGVRLADSVAARLAQLSRRVPVAVVTGRSRADVAVRLGFVPQDIIGHHGAEDPALENPFQPGDAWEACRQWVLAATAVLSRSGIRVEDKGQSLSLHTRAAPDPVAAVTVIDTLIAGLPQLAAVRCIGGKCVMNLVPADAPDKGDAVWRLLRRHGATHALFAGDDLNDEPVFSTAAPDWLTIRVGGLLTAIGPSAAQFYLNSPGEVHDMLTLILATIPGHNPPETGEFSHDRSVF